MKKLINDNGKLNSEQGTIDQRMLKVGSGISCSQLTHGERKEIIFQVYIFPDKGFFPFTGY